eukprot:TRINITY_DN18391_c0_g1_i4.p1 TRINITY_DN18391_c0_g1~~TRINITY_DN18391_c0_g1_i4.p1  ORF type:complete len:586 (-),score=73.85 TRINITY_DN18391_c0_g1_i4:83-1840(-)
MGMDLDEQTVEPNMWQRGLSASSSSGSHQDQKAEGPRKGGTEFGDAKIRLMYSRRPTYADTDRADDVVSQRLRELGSTAASRMIVTWQSVGDGLQITIVAPSEDCWRLVMLPLGNICVAELYPSKVSGVEWLPSSPDLTRSGPAASQREEAPLRSRFSSSSPRMRDSPVPKEDSPGPTSFQEATLRPRSSSPRHSPRPTEDSLGPTSFQVLREFPAPSGLPAKMGISRATRAVPGPEKVPAPAKVPRRCGSVGTKSYPVEQSTMLNCDSRVFLNIFDLVPEKWFPGPSSFAAFMSLGQAIGACHTGVEVFGVEWYFSGIPQGTGVCRSSSPRRESMCYRRTIACGQTNLKPLQLQALIETHIAPQWPASRYNILNCNCNFFSREFLLQLGVGVPSFLDFTRLGEGRMFKWPSACSSRAPARSSSRNVRVRQEISVQDIDDDLDSNQGDDNVYCDGPESAGDIREVGEEELLTATKHKLPRACVGIVERVSAPRTRGVHAKVVNQPLQQCNSVMLGCCKDVAIHQATLGDDSPKVFVDKQARRVCAEDDEPVARLVDPAEDEPAVGSVPSTGTLLAQEIVPNRIAI